MVSSRNGLAQMIRINLLDFDPVRGPSKFKRKGVASTHQGAVADNRPSLRMLADVALHDDKDDLLDFKPFANAISGVIDSPRTSTPLVMAINAKWGAGKTTLAQMIKRRLEEKPAAEGNFPHVTCWFNAWMHDDSSSLATALAAEVAQTANASRSLLRRVANPLPTTLSSTRSKRLRKGFLYLGAISAIILACSITTFWFGYSPAELVKLDPRIFKSIATIRGGAYVGALLAGLILLFKAAAAILPVAKSVGEFVRDPQSTAKTASMKEVREQLGRLIKQATPKHSKFVIFIDDLDRCHPPRSIDILEVANQLLDHPGAVIILMADMQVVTKCAEIKYRLLIQSDANKAGEASLNSPTYGWDYLQKIVQIQFDLPTYPEAVIRRMIATLARQVPQVNEQSRISRVTRKLWKRILRLLSRAFDQTGREYLPYGLMTVAAGSYLLLRLANRSGWLGSAWPRPLTSFSLGLAFSILGGGLLTLALQTLLSLRVSRRRKLLDDEIKSRIEAGERDFARVERSVQSSNKSLLADAVTRGLLRERLQRYLEDESELQQEAEDEVTRHLDPLPRHAKRLLNRLRLLLFVAHERRMFGGNPILSPRHIGKWAVLCERWPELAQAIARDPKSMTPLEDRSHHDHTIKKLAPLYQGDDALKLFCTADSGPLLANLIERIVQFRPAEDKY